MKKYTAEITFETAFGETAKELKSLLKEEFVHMEFDNVKVKVKRGENVKNKEND